MYFDKFTDLLYEFQIKGKTTGVLVTDITKNIRFRRDVLANVTLYDLYDIQDGETPEIIAEKFYEDPNLHWVIMLANEKFDYINDFPMDYYKLNRYINDKYGDTTYDIHHWEDSDGNIVMADFVGAVGITNYDYEQRVNESKRTIKIISPDLLFTILKNFEELI